MRFPMSSSTLSLSPLKGEGQKRSVQNLNN